MRSLHSFKRLLYLLPLLCGSAWGSLALDGSGHSNNTGTCSLTTTSSNDNIVMVATINAGAGTGGSQISSITSTNTTSWARRSGVAATSSSTNGIEMWRGKAASAITSETITVNFANSPSFETLDCFGISGSDVSTIWDSNGSLPATAQSAIVSVSTSNANDFLIGAYRFGSTASPTQGTGWTIISGANFQLTEYKIVSATQSGLSVAIGTGAGDQNAGLGDAVIAASGSTPQPAPQMMMSGIGR